MMLIVMTRGTMMKMSISPPPMLMTRLDCWDQPVNDVLNEGTKREKDKVEKGA